MKLEWTETALETLEAIRDHVVDLADEETAHRLIKTLVARAEQLPTFHASGRTIPELRDPTKREILAAPYRIQYRFDADESSSRLFLLAFVHGSQLLENTIAWDLLIDEESEQTRPIT